MDKEKDKEKDKEREKDKDEIDFKFKKLLNMPNNPIMFVRECPGKVTHSFLNLIKYPLEKTGTLNFMKRKLNIKELKVIFYSNQHIDEIPKTLKK